MEMLVRFPGGRKVNAEFDGFTLATDQPKDAGGEGSAPAPFDLFLGSLACCAGLFALSFCQKRGIPTAGLELRQSAQWNEETHLVSVVRVSIRLPEGFPEKYRAALVKAVELCTVKRHLAAPPAFEVTARPF